MKRIAICCLVLVFLAVRASGYQVFEEPEEDDETVRGKRQQSGASLIDSIFNIPITAIKQTSQAAQTLSPGNAGAIESVLKIPVSTLEAVGNLIKNRQQNRYQTTPLSTTRPNRRYDVDQVNEVERRRRDEYKRRVEAQREQQRRWQEQLNRRRMDQLIQHNRRMQQQIVAEDERTHHSFYRDPFGFNALTKWVVGPHGVFNGHAGHGDGHVYQYYNPQKPLHFGGHHNQGTHRPTPTKPTIPQGSTVSTTTSTSSSTSTSFTSTSTNPPRPTHNYEVHENVDEGNNPFSWPNWFGIINVLTSATQQSYPSDDRLQNKIAPKKTKVRFDEPPLQNKIAPKDNDYFKAKYYAKARKNSSPEEELTGNEIDGNVGSGERLGLNERGARVLFPTN
ncbi:uncharacterized protein LOC100121233 isoform X2 [Nasonia vitripennis]|uniref:Uncharacterized protein n=1 Tax=Nasonia vitripennis TaxID=7425 RepID=A0A7M7G5C8_NASVI|nr:uncharacterized protein LOC100121233 isoform X2 [Nasonia vitripennis]